MGATCTVCTHIARAAIDQDLAVPEANLSALSRQYDLKRDALRRHRDGHLPRLLVEWGQEAEALRAGQIHAQAQDLYRRALANLAEAERGVLVPGSGVRLTNRESVTKALREARASLDMLTRLAVHASAGTQVADDGTVQRALDAAMDRALRRVLDQRTDVEDAIVLSDTGAVDAVSAALPVRSTIERSDRPDDREARA